MQEIHIRRKTSTGKSFFSLLRISFVWCAAGVALISFPFSLEASHDIFYGIGAAIMAIAMIGLPLAIGITLFLYPFLWWKDKNNKELNLMMWQRVTIHTMPTDCNVENRTDISELAIGTYPFPLMFGAPSVQKYVKYSLQQAVVVIDKPGTVVCYLIPQKNKNPIDIFLDDAKSEKDIIPFQVIYTDKKFADILNTIVKNNPGCKIDPNLLTFEEGENWIEPDGKTGKITEYAFKLFV